VTEKSEYGHMGGGVLKLLKRPSYAIWTFPILHLVTSSHKTLKARLAVH